MPGILSLMMTSVSFSGELRTGYSTCLGGHPGGLLPFAVT